MLVAVFAKGSFAPNTIAKPPPGSAVAELVFPSPTVNSALTG